MPTTTESSEKSCLSKVLDFTLPWWFKIVAYALSYSFMAVCIFFIIVKGIEFGNEKVEKWLTSLLISILTSIFLTQPIQVICAALFFVLIFRKYDDKKDLETDPEDHGQSLNDDKSMLKYRVLLFFLVVVVVFVGL